jgi:hypothetical protein
LFGMVYQSLRDVQYQIFHVAHLLHEINPESDPTLYPPAFVKPGRIPTLR